MGEQLIAQKATLARQEEELPRSGFYGLERPSATSRYEVAFLYAARELGMWGLRNVKTTLRNGRSLMSDLTANWKTETDDLIEFNTRAAFFVHRKYVEKMREMMQIPGIYHIWIGDTDEESLAESLRMRALLRKDEKVTGTLTDEYYHVPLNVDDKTLIGLMRNVLETFISKHVRQDGLKYIKEDKFLYVTGMVDERPEE